MHSNEDSNMHRIVTLVALLISSQTLRAAEWQTLFNSRDLTGWQANNNPESFTVKDGVIRIQSPGKECAHLFYIGEPKGVATQEMAKTGRFPPVEPVKFKNFELEAVVRAEPNSNGGIFIHTDMSVRDKALHLAKGYEVQLNSSAKEKRKTGSLYAIVDLDTSPVDETEWFTINIKVRDKRITVAIDGKEILDYTEPPNVERPTERAGRLLSVDGGGIALQAHDKESVWYFKEVRVKRLD
jgi:hypothetical protein